MNQLESNGLTMVDLFCGAGVGAMGFKYAGYDIIDGIDNMPYAVDTYNINVGEHARLGDIKMIPSSDIPYADVYVSTPPCKSFSAHGKNLGRDDPENGSLFEHTIRIIQDNQPKAFIIENVKGLTYKKHSDFFEWVIKEFAESGYRVSWKLSDCYEYGVPQKRDRVFIVGVRKDIGGFFDFPFPDGQLRTVRDAIGDLPEPCDSIKNHHGYGVRPDEAPFVDKIPIGGNWKDLCEEDQKTFMKGGYKNRHKGGNTGFLRKISMDEPAKTITSQMKGKSNAQLLDLKDKFGDTHESQSRRFTVRECLRLQTVPDEFYFPEDIALAKQYERCSGIPSLVAYKLGVELAKMLK